MINILHDEEKGYACLYDSVTMQAMGPIFYLASEEPQDFLDYCEAKSGQSDGSWPSLDYAVHEWRTFEAELVEKLEAWGFRQITKDGPIIDMDWERYPCYCKKADLHNATSAEDVLQACTFFDEEENEIDYTQFKSSQI